MKKDQLKFEKISKLTTEELKSINGGIFSGDTGNKTWDTQNKNTGTWQVDDDTTPDFGRR
jgi:bacteriocin-like protein